MKTQIQMINRREQVVTVQTGTMHQIQSLMQDVVAELGQLQRGHVTEPTMQAELAILDDHTTILVSTLDLISSMIEAERQQ